MSQPHVLIARTRPGRVRPTIADWVCRRAKDHGDVNVELVDLAEAALPLLGRVGASDRHPPTAPADTCHARGLSPTLSATPLGNHVLLNR